MRRRATTAVAVFIALALLLGASSPFAPHASAQAQAPGPAPSNPWTLLPLHAWRGPGAGVFDAAGRQVLLRGINVDGLGDHYQAGPVFPPVTPLTAGDYAEMASRGINTIRLLVHWSALEPTRGEIDQAYLARIRDAVDHAKANGMYVVLDMHQDAWGKHTTSPPGVSCPDGYEPSIGGDGAPAWATITDGADTCHTGALESSPAVVAAFENFYADRDGIQADLALTWAALAGAFATEPAVAGYDLFDEPSWGTDLAADTAQLGDFYGRTIEAIRQAENAGRGFEHIVFFEPVVLWPMPSANVPVEAINDPNMVFAPHNYFESRNQVLTIEQGFALAAASQNVYGSTFWFGEYGWFGDPALDKEKAVRFGQQEDHYLVGGAVGPEWASVVSRPYPRAAPGHLQTLASDGDAASIALVGRQDPGAQAVTQPLEIWVPDRGQGIPEAEGVNVFDVGVSPVPGGFRITATVCGTYALAIGAPVADLPSGCTGDPSSPTGVSPVVAVPAFTG